MLLVKDIMSEKIVTISPAASVKKAVELLLDEDVGSLMVVDDNQRMVGLLNESALLAATFDGQIRNDPVSLHMERNFLHVRPHDSIDSVIDASILHQVRQLPVIENRRLVGLVTRRDLLRAVFGRIQVAAAS